MGEESAKPLPAFDHESTKACDKRIPQPIRVEAPTDLVTCGVCEGREQFAKLSFANMAGSVSRERGIERTLHDVENPCLDVRTYRPCRCVQDLTCSRNRIDSIVIRRLPNGTVTDTFPDGTCRQ